MKPILYNAAETLFDTNGIGILSDAISCIVKAELNGQYELTLQYPLNGLHAAGLVQRNIILAKVDPVSRPQPFRIYKIHKPMNSVITVNARHVAYDLAGVAVTPFTAATAPLALNGLSANAVTGCPFTFSTDKTTAAAFAVAVPSTIWSLLGGVKGSVLDVYGGEYEYDRWDVKLHSRRGADRGVSIRYGKNLTSLEQDENCANCYTGVMPYWVDKQTGAVTMLPARVVNAEGNFGYTKILPVDMSGDFETVPTADQLTAAAKAYIKANSIGQPVVSWKVEYVQLEQTEEYKGKALLERVLLGDTVHVEFADMGVSVSARVVAVEYDCILNRYKSVTLGSAKANLASTIVNQNKEISELPTETQMKKVLLQLTNAILGANGGAVRLLDSNGDGEPDTLYIADNPDPALAVKVWRFNYEGWGASKNGYNGPFVMGATFDTGIAADFIKAGTLDAALVKVVNLIVDHLVSPMGDACLEIFGSVLTLKCKGETVASLAEEYGGYPMLALMNAQSGMRRTRLQLTPDSMAVEDYSGSIPPPVLAFFGWSLDNDRSELAVDAVNPGKKVLYTGSVARNGTFTVPNTASYDLFAVRVSADSEQKPGVILAYKDGNTIHGMGGWGGDSSTRKETYWISVTYSGNTWTLVHGSRHDLSLATGAWSAGTEIKVLSVIGII